MDYLNSMKGKKVRCRICDITDNTGTGDLDDDWHEGFTIRTGKELYWMMVWSRSGNVTVYHKEHCSPRWISGDTQITIHFKD